MTKYNTKEKGINLTVNHEGAKAYKIGAEMELYSIACTSIMADKFYESEKDQLKRIQDLIKKVPHEFTAKLAVYCREQMYLRTIPIVLAQIIATGHIQATIPQAFVSAALIFQHLVQNNC